MNENPYKVETVLSSDSIETVLKGQRANEKKNARQCLICMTVAADPV